MPYYRRTPHLMSDVDRLAAAMRLVRAATGASDWEDVVDWLTGAGIGYTGTTPSAGMSDVWVTGNWNTLQHYDSDARRYVDNATGADVPKRLWEALDRIGVNGEWSDEHTTCDDCQRLIRTEPDSYGWTAQYVVFDSRGEYGDYSAGDTVCADCLRDNAESVIADQYANRSDRALTWLTEAQLTELGWRDAMPDSASAASGLHPGQDDTPAAIVEQWRATDLIDQTDYVFLITDKGQFDIHYRLFVKDNDDN